MWAWFIEQGHEWLPIVKDWWKAATAAGVVGAANAAYTWHTARRNRIADQQQQAFATRIRNPVEERLNKIEQAVQDIEIAVRQNDPTKLRLEIANIQQQSMLPALREARRILGRTASAQKDYSDRWQAIVDKFEDVITDAINEALDPGTIDANVAQACE